MAKLTDVEMPNGRHLNLMKPTSWVAPILGVVAFAGVVTVGMKLYSMFTALLPGNVGKMLGGRPFIRTNQNSTPAPTGPTYNIIS